MSRIANIGSEPDSVPLAKREHCAKLSFCKKVRPCTGISIRVYIQQKMRGWDNENISVLNLISFDCSGRLFSSWMPVHSTFVYLSGVDCKNTNNHKISGSF